MSDCTDNTKPIAGTSLEVTIGNAPATLETHGSFSIDPNATEIRLSFDIEPVEQFEPAS